MTRKLRWLHGYLLGATLACPTFAWADDCCGGKWWCMDKCANIPPGAQPAPAGTYLRKFASTQAGLAEADDFVFYKHMWYMGGTSLGPLGRYQLDMITRRLAGVPFPVVIETTQNEALDEARREAIATFLAARGFDDPTRVIVAYPVAEALYGDEAPIIASRFLLGDSNRGSIGNPGSFTGTDFLGGFRSLGGR